MVKNGVTEERPLLYVAITRAKDDLHLIVPQRSSRMARTRGGDRHVCAATTRFKVSARRPSTIAVSHECRPGLAAQTFFDANAGAFGA